MVTIELMSARACVRVRVARADECQEHVQMRCGVVFARVLVTGVRLTDRQQTLA